MIVWLLSGVFILLGFVLKYFLDGWGVIGLLFNVGGDLLGYMFCNELILLILKFLLFK